MRLMGQAGRYLRAVASGHSHWCPACEESHLIPNSWTFNGNLDAPTFEPSVKITGKQCVIVDGEWTGEWRRDADGKAIDGCCHYILTNGALQFCSDCTHALVGQTVPLPELPAHLRD